MISFSTSSTIRFVALAATSVLALTACVSDGTSLRAPTADQTTTTRPVVTSALPEEESSSGISLQSPDFEPGGAIPVSATCAGGSVLPTLTWNDVPEGTVELAITLSDQTNFEEPLLVYLVAGIDPSIRSIEDGALPEGAVETLNDWGSQGFGSPCLEAISGEGNTRDLQFRLHALSSTPQVQDGGHGSDSWDAVRTRATESAALLMRFFPEPDIVEDPLVTDETFAGEDPVLSEDQPLATQTPQSESSTTLPAATGAGSDDQTEDSPPELNATSIFE